MNKNCERGLLLFLICGLITSFFNGIEKNDDFDLIGVYVMGLQAKY